MLFAPYRLAFLALAPLTVTVAMACSSSSSGKGSDSPYDDWAGESRDTEIKHEECDIKGKEVRNFKGDSALSSGKSFVTRVYANSREVCSWADLNGDGNIDVYTFFGEDGKIRRREAAYSVSKQIDEIAIYQGGNLQVVMRETNFDGKLDTWDYYEGGKLVRRERDKTGDGRIDEWWTFEPGTENATIVQADVHTGKPDPSSTVKLGISAQMGGYGDPKAAAPDAAVADTNSVLAPSLGAGGAPAADAATDAKTDAKTDASPDTGKKVK
jgi:hypothetical protein